ncbi:MAG: type II toxin-antitoxin system Phd/YefM family antitoxin [Massilia sp.]
MKTVDIGDARTNLADLVEAARKGEEIVISKAGRPAVRLVAVQVPKVVRRPGAMKGRIRVADDFDAPLPDQIQATFEGK